MQKFNVRFLVEFNVIYLVAFNVRFESGDKEISNVSFSWNNFQTPVFGICGCVLDSEISSVNVILGALQSFITFCNICSCLAALKKLKQLAVALFLAYPPSSSININILQFSSVVWGYQHGELSSFSISTTPAKDDNPVHLVRFVGEHKFEPMSAQARHISLLSLYCFLFPTFSGSSKIPGILLSLVGILESLEEEAR